METRDSISSSGLPAPQDSENLDRKRLVPYLCINEKGVPFGKDTIAQSAIKSHMELAVRLLNQYDEYLDDHVISSAQWHQDVIIDSLKKNTNKKLIPCLGFGTAPFVRHIENACDAFPQDLTYLNEMLNLARRHDDYDYMIVGNVAVEIGAGVEPLKDWTRHPREALELAARDAKAYKDRFPVFAGE